jgi:putative hemolysin
MHCEMLSFELFIIVFLIVINGLLSMSELAVVSSRPARLSHLASKGVRGAGRALALASDPGKFLSTVQIGITLVGILSGAFSGATLGLRLTQWMIELGLPSSIADVAGVAVVVTIITYATLIVGELVPKQVALRNPESVAVKVAPAMDRLAKISLPLVVLLDLSGRFILALLGRGRSVEEMISEDEIHHFGERGRECRRARTRRKGNDRGRDAPWRPTGWCGDDAAHGRRRGRPQR